MTITTDAQAEAAREYLEIVDKAKEIQKILNLGTWVDTAKMQAALAAYEAQKAVKDIVLSDDELAYLRYADMNSSGITPYFDVKRSLVQKRFIIDKTEPIITDAGCAYLAAQPKQELRWEVWAKQSMIHGNKGVICCTCYNVDSARLIKGFYEDWRPTVEYEVREVR